jgi:hypothetical protein
MHHLLDSLSPLQPPGDTPPVCASASLLYSEPWSPIAPAFAITGKEKTAITAFEFDRRAVLAMGAAFTLSGAHRAVAADGDFPARLSEMQRDGRVSGLHTS